MHEADKTVLVGLALVASLLVGLLAAGMLGSGDTDISRVELHTGLHKLNVDGTSLWAEVVRTREGRTQGLSDRERLPANQGMLFVFDESGSYPVWMRHMQFPLDIYWISSDGVIVDMWMGARPESYPSIYTPTKDARYVLEVVAGFSEVYNIEKGDRVTNLPTY